MSEGRPPKGRQASGKVYSVPALSKALDVLELLSESALSMSQAEISRSLGRGTSEIFRTLSALEDRGYIRRTQAGQYRLTLKLFELSRTHSPYEELLRVALPLMRELSEELRETCHLSALQDGEIVVLAQHESPKAVRLSIEVGSRHPLLGTTSGRILLAAMEESACARLLRERADFAGLPQALQESFLTRIGNVRERGYEVADGERFVGGLDVGALVGTPRSETRAALIVATLRSAAGPDPEALRGAVLRVSREMTRRIGLD